MANAIPMLEGTPARRLQRARHAGETLQNTILRESAVLGLARVDRVAGRRQKYTVYAGRPVATFVAEGAPKSTTGAEWAEITVDVKKIVAQVIYTEEILEDAREDPRVLVNADVEGAIADTIDAHALGYAQRRRDRRFVRLGTDEHDARRTRRDRRCVRARRVVPHGIDRRQRRATERRHRRVGRSRNLLRDARGRRHDSSGLHGRLRS
jgi:hypothetical protein